MKQVISGKVYNTETATLIADWGNGLSTRDFGHCSESLYITKKGAYFIAGEGGAQTKYAQSCGDGIGSGENIEPIKKDEALLWCETHDVDPDTIGVSFDDGGSGGSGKNSTGDKYTVFEPAIESRAWPDHGRIVCAFY